MTTDAPVCDICGEPMVMQPCPECGGSGVSSPYHYDMTEDENCPVCKGEGEYPKCSRALVISADVSRKDA